MEEEKINWEELEKMTKQVGKFPPFLGWGKNVQKGEYVLYLFGKVRTFKNKWGHTQVSVYGAMENNGKWEIYTVAISSKKLLGKLLPYLKQLHEENGVMKFRITWNGVGFDRDYQVEQLDVNETEIRSFLKTVKEEYPNVLEQLGFPNAKLKEELKSETKVDSDKANGLLRFIKNTLLITDKIPYPNTDIIEKWGYDWETFLTIEDKLKIKKKGNKKFIVGVKE